MAEASAAQRLRAARATWTAPRLAALLLGCLLLPGCASWPLEAGRSESEPSRPAPGEGPVIPGELPAPAPVPAPEAESAPRAVPLPAPETEPLPPPSYHPAGEALVEQARREAMLGNDAMAGATLERALRVDGNNPWIWIELGHLRLAAGQRAAAEGMARKALSLSVRDPAARGAAATLLRQAGSGP
jgi:hypothetical protein